MKKILVIFSLVLTVFLSVKSYAMNISCTNGSCVGSDGALKIYWESPTGGIGLNSATFADITGLDGLPVTISNYKQIINSINSSKTVSNKLINEIDNKTGISIPEITGINVGSDKSVKKENAYDISKNMSQNLSNSNSININYNLDFAYYIGKNYYPAAPAIWQVVEGAKKILSLYRAGNYDRIDELLQMFIFHNNKKVVDKLNIFTPITSSDNYLMSVLYMGLISKSRNFIYDPFITHVNEVRKIQKNLFMTLVKNQSIGQLTKKNKSVAIIEYLAIKYKKPYKSYAKNFIYYYYGLRKSKNNTYFFTGNHIVFTISKTDFKKYKDFVLVPSHNKSSFFIIIIVVIILAGGIGFIVYTIKKAKK
ncbi:MAG: hypothetical protein EVJ48_01950 [Candidatus Acidulodesulfobacterium acidiphilum]|uniref:Uncharacterized protein n=1 Tax=Candidatus Acidulodesulfobacterium acidiphilum TaxID=2597224 RepID=A0A520XGF2_9DELT|nr:MAG: hypothetical protein EVJ48_01950 [Candidatus Acidulodesulfobacterium acidiphilum]